MPNSKNKLKSVLSFLSGLLTIAKYLPFFGKWRQLIVALSAIVGTLSAIKCDQQPTAPKETTEPPPTPEPTPTPSPKPTPPPLPELKAPKFVKVGESFQVQLCNAGNKYNVKLFADRWLLGHMGFGEPCMVLNVALNTAGERRLHIDSDTLQLETIVVVKN